MVKTKRVRLPYHKQALGDQIEDPESQGVRVRACAASSQQPPCHHMCVCRTASPLAAFSLSLCLQTKPRRGKRRKTAGGSDDEGGEDEAVSEPPPLPC